MYASRAIASATPPPAVTCGATGCITGGNKNVIALLNQNGSISAKYAYSPFGKLISAQGADAADCNFRFSSEYLDTESGLVYYNYRYYSPQLGRWLSRDPIGERGGYNLYRMVRNNPLYWWDYLGKDIWIENTTAAGRFHRRVCVTQWKVSKKRTKCCRRGHYYEKSGKFCISFGVPEGAGSLAVFPSSRSSKGGSLSSEHEKKPPGMKDIRDDADGEVYIDDEDHATKEVERYEQDCHADKAAYDYMTSLVYNRADYCAYSQNCRDFSKYVFEKLKKDNQGK